MASQHADQHGMDLPEQANRAQRSRQRRKVDPLALVAVAVRLRQGVPSRRNCRRVATTRTVAVGPRWLWYCA